MFERERHPYSAYGQTFKWPVDDADVRRDGFVDVDWLVKRGSHIADEHILVLRMSESMLFGVGLPGSPNVQLGSKADIPHINRNVCFTSDVMCPPGPKCSRSC